MSKFIVISGKKFESKGMYYLFENIIFFHLVLDIKSYALLAQNA